MNEIDKNIDQIILLKGYHELSSAEKNAIKDIAVTEAEFNDAKRMLQLIESQILDIEDITPKNETKDYLISEFNRIRPAKAERPSGLGIFFPSNKPFHQKLGVQIIAAAAVLLLIVTLFIPRGNDLTHQKVTAMTEKKNVVSEETLIKSEEKIIVAESDLENKELETNTDLEAIDEKSKNEQTIEKTIAKDEKPASPVVVDVLDYAANTTSEKIEGNKPTVSDISILDSEEIDDDYVSDGLASEVLNEVDKTSKKDISSNQNMTVQTGAAATMVTDEVAVSEDLYDTDLAVAPAMAETSVFNRKADSKLNESANKSPVKLSKTLAENKELIKYFYTAM